jgi:hypothetical protein
LTYGIELIPGCEFTDSNGAHIIGLFVGSKSRFPKYGSSARSILDYIHGEGGFAVMPHPWKPGSGYMALNGDRSNISMFHFIEIINGGWRSDLYIDQIKDVARSFNIKMICSSDAHRAFHVGMCCTAITGADPKGGARQALRLASQESLKFLVDDYLINKNISKSMSSDIQKSVIYQRALPLIPPAVRRAIKTSRYRLSDDRFARKPAFKIFDKDSLPW